MLLFLDPGSGIRDLVSGMGKNLDRGSGINIPDPQHCWVPYMFAIPVHRLCCFCWRWSRRGVCNHHHQQEGTVSGDGVPTNTEKLFYSEASTRIDRFVSWLRAGLLKGRPEFKSRLGTPGRFFPLSEAMKKMERGLGEWRWMSVLYECNYECM